jgi:hypothetical protein
MNGKERTMEANAYVPAGARLVTEGSGAAPELWNPNSVALWSFLFTPVFGTALTLRNYRALGDERGVRSAWAWLIVSLLAFLPSAIVPKFAILYLVVWYLAWQQKQVRAVSSRWGKSYPRRGWTLPLLFGLACLVMLGLIRSWLKIV